MLIGIPGLCGLQMQLIARVLVFISYHNHSGDIHICLYGRLAYFRSALQSNWSHKLNVASTASVWNLLPHHDTCQNALPGISSSLIRFFLSFSSSCLLPL